MYVCIQNLPCITQCHARLNIQLYETQIQQQRKYENTATLHSAS